jgi:hypothetical protein
MTTTATVSYVVLFKKTAGKIRRGWIELHDQLAKCGNQPQKYILDNEASNDLKKTLKKYNLDYQLVPPHLHHRNAAERAIQTYKNHLLACLASCDPDFPVSECEQLFFQVGLTLNLLRSSRVNPKLSAYTYLHGHFDFNNPPPSPNGDQGSCPPQAR